MDASGGGFLGVHPDSNIVRPIGLSVRRLGGWYVQLRIAALPRIRA